MQNFFQHNDRNISPTNHQGLKDSSAINKNTERYTTSSTHEFLKILFNWKEIKTVTLKYATRHRVGCPVTDKKNVFLDQADNDEDFYAFFWNKHNYFMARYMNWYGNRSQFQWLGYKFILEI